MIYYLLGLAISTVVFSFFLTILRGPVNEPYVWMAVFSLAFLSAAAALIFLIGLVLNVTQQLRQRNQIAGGPTRPRSHLARHDAIFESMKRDIARSAEHLPHWLTGNTGEKPPENTNPTTRALLKVRHQATTSSAGSCSVVSST